MKQCEQQRERRRAYNDLCSNVERERRGLVEEGSTIGLDEKGRDTNKVGFLHKQKSRVSNWQIYVAHNVKSTLIELILELPRGATFAEIEYKIS